MNIKKLKSWLRGAVIAVLAAVWYAAAGACGFVGEPDLSSEGNRAETQGFEPVSRAAGDVYNFYPGTGYYPSGSSETFVWQTPSGPAYEDFASYEDGGLIESSANKSLQSHLEITSGVLSALHINGSQLYKRATTNTYNFRMLIQGLYDGQRVKWTDQALRVRFYIDSWQDTNTEWQGVHLFTRYRTEDDLYVASLRSNGEVLIKEVVNDAKHTLVEGQLRDQNGNVRPFNTRQWYTLTFVAIGNNLRFYVDGVLQLETTDGSFSWGTAGIRTDYANVILDDVRLFDDLSGL